MCRSTFPVYLSFIRAMPFSFFAFLILLQYISSCSPYEDFEILQERVRFRNGMSAKNRLLKAAISERLASFTDDLKLRGWPNQKLINVYDKWARGNFGVILTGNVIVHPTHLEGAGNMIVSPENDSLKLRNWYKKLAGAIKTNGSLAIAQISDAGVNTPASIDQEPWAASEKSAKTFAKNNSRPKVLNDDEVLRDLIPRYVYAAKLLFECGFDGIELHSAPISLLSHFLSAEFNDRVGVFGSNNSIGVHGRITIFKHIADGIRESLPKGSRFLVGVKIHVNEFLKNNKIQIDDATISARLFDEFGYDFIELTGSSKAVGYRGNKGGNFDALKYEKFRDAFKNFDHKYALYLTGMFRNMSQMVKVLSDGYAQGIGLGRPATAQPNVAAQLLSGNLTSISTPMDKESTLISIMAAASQIWDMAEKVHEEGKSLSEGITDFSNEMNIANFKKELKQFMDESEEKEERLEIVHGIFHYKPKKLIFNY